MKYTFLLLLLILSACSSKQQNQQNASNVGDLNAQIDELFNTKIDENGAGAALLVAYNGEMIIGKGYGNRDVKNVLPITKATNMRMASLSKQFTVLAILNLVDKGIIKLEDEAHSVFPFESLKGITIEQLINHTSGIADAEAAFFEEWDSTKVAVNNDIVEWYSRNPEPYFEPGSKWQYNNGAYELLAAMVEKLSGESFDDFAKENVLKKAEMHNSRFFNLAKPVVINEQAYCYGKNSHNEWEKVDDHFLNGLLGAGGLYTSINDFFSYDNALRDERLLSEELHSIIFQPSSMLFPRDGEVFQYNTGYSFVGEGDQYYGLGWFVSGQIAFHSGSWFGTRTFVIHELERPLTIAVFLNSDDSSLRNELINQTYTIVDGYLSRLNDN